MKLKQWTLGGIFFLIMLWLCYNFYLYRHLKYKQVYKNKFLNNNVLIPKSKIVSDAEKTLLCYEEDTRVNGFPEFNEKIDIDESKRYIFFHETSCDINKQIEFNMRQACAIESTAYSNPTATIFVLFLSPMTLNKSSSSVISNLLKYKNIKIRRIRVQDYIASTPITELYYSGTLRTSHWIRCHMSDVLRYTTLYKYGGIYIDLDFIVMSDLTHMQDFASAESNNLINSAFLGLSKSKIGRKVSEKCLMYLKNNYRGDQFNVNGPGVITAVSQQICNTEKLEEMKPEICEGFTIYPTSMVYPIPYENWKNYFTNDNLNSTMNLITKAKAIHVWNMLSHNEKVQCNSNVPYTLMAQKYCPNVFQSCSDTF